MPPPEGLRPPRPRVPPVRERALVLRFAVLRVAVPPAAFVARFAAGLRPALERVDAGPADFARAAVLRVPLVLRAPVLLRAPDEVLRAELDVEPELALPSASTLHLPDITRCAASATASAMIEPSLVALDMTLVAAADAVSAASSPASRILRRAAGLALIAAAAAAKPAASISLLIAALANLSTVSFPEDFELEELFVEALAIALVSLACGNIALAL